MSGASRLGIYNKALGHLEERKLKSLTENREPRRALDDEWDDAVEFCLYRAFWNFSLRLYMVTPNTDLTPQFGFVYAFTKPTDWVKTFQIADNENFNPPLQDFTDQNGVWYASIAPIYVRIVSNDPDFGMNMSLWTPGFKEYLAAYLAWKIAPRLKQDREKVDALKRLVKEARIDAISLDATDLPPGRQSYGTWVTSRAPRGSVQPMGSPFGSGSDGGASVGTPLSTDGGDVLVTD